MRSVNTKTTNNISNDFCRMVPDAACTHATSSAKSPYDAVKMISGVYQI